MTTDTFKPPPTQPSHLRAGTTATLRESYTGHVTGSSNPSISHGARVEIQDLHWGDGICWASIVVLESKDADQVGCVAVLPVGRLKVEVAA